MLIGILGGVVPVVAQTPQPQSTLFEEAIVVTASLDEEQESDVPAAVSVIEAVEIEARQATEVAALLASLPAMTVVQSGSPGQVTSLFTRGTNSDQTLVLWNGVELNDPYFGGFNWAFMPTEGVGRVEAVRGPFSSLYGGDALGGVVQILSAPREGADLQLEGGENGYRRGQVSASTNFGSTHFEVAGHLRRGEGRVDNDFFDGEALMARADWEILLEMMKRAGLEQPDYSHPGEIYAEMASLSPKFAGISHRRIESEGGLQRIVNVDGQLAARAADGTLIVPVRSDHAVWSKQVEGFAESMARAAGRDPEVMKARIVFSGTLSPTARQRMEGLGLAVTEEGLAPPEAAPAPEPLPEGPEPERLDEAR